MLNPRATRANPGWKWCTHQPRPCHTKICVTRDSWCGCMQQRTFVHAIPCVSWCIKRKHSGAWSGVCGNMRYARCNPWVLNVATTYLVDFPNRMGISHCLVDYQRVCCWDVGLPSWSTPWHHRDKKIAYWSCWGLGLRPSSRTFMCSPWTFSRPTSSTVCAPASWISWHVFEFYFHSVRYGSVVFGG